MPSTTTTPGAAGVGPNPAPLDRPELGGRFGRMSLALRCPPGRAVSGEPGTVSRPLDHRFHARSHILLAFVKGKVERETGFEPATFCLGSSGHRALWHERGI